MKKKKVNGKRKKIQRDEKNKIKGLEEDKKRRKKIKERKKETQNS